MQATFKAAIERHIAIQKNHALNTLADEAGFVVSPVRQGQQPTGVVFRREGKLVQMAAPRDVKVAVEGLNTEELNGLAKVMSALNKPLRMGATQFNPTFLAANAVSDYLQALVREGLRPGDLARAYEAALNKSALYHAMVRKGGGFGDEGSWFTGRAGSLGKDLARMEREIRNSGGIVVGKGDFQKIIAAIERKDVKALAKYFGTLGPIPTVGAAIEQGPRVAAFAKHMEPKFFAAKGRHSSGWDELAEWAETQGPEITASAAMAARRVTVDFSRIGQYMRTMNAMVPFLNAQVQGALNVGRTLRDEPDSRKRVGALVTLAVATQAWNKIMFPEEDADIPDYVKEGSIYVILPGSEKNPNGLGFKKINYVALPVRTYGAFTHAVTEAMAVIQGQPASLDALGRVLDATNPFPGDPILRDIRPAPVASFGGIKENLDPFTGREIVPQSEQDRLSATPWLQYGPTTTEMAKRLSKAIADMPDIPGVSDFLRGYFSSPRQIDYFVKANLGGGGRRAEEAISQALGQGSTKPPVVGGLLSTIYRDYGGATQQKAYESRDKELAKLHRDNGDLGEWMVRNVDLPIQEPPADLTLTDAYDGSSLGSVFLLPKEQVLYQQEFLKALREGVMDFQDLIKDEPLIDRKLDARMVVSEARDLAKEKTLDSLPDEEIDRRVEVREQNPIPPSHRQANEQFYPLEAR